VILAVAQFGQPSRHCGEVVGISAFEFQEEFLHRASSGMRFIKL